jgi:hypothetical protein
MDCTTVPSFDRRTVALTIATGLQLAGHTALPSLETPDTKAAITFSHALQSSACNLRKKQLQLICAGSVYEAHLIFETVERALVNTETNDASVFEMLLAENGRRLPCSTDGWFYTTIHAHSLGQHSTMYDNASAQKRYRESLARMTAYGCIATAIESVVSSLALQLEELCSTKNNRT